MGAHRRTAVVTGGATGIGRRIARRLARDGYHAVLLDVEDAADTVDLVEADGGSAEYRAADVTDAASLAAAFDGLGVDVLVNNAAYYAPLVGGKKPFWEIEGAEWDRVLAVNAKGVFLASKHALPAFADGGRIVNIASAVVHRGTTGFLHYVASKAAVIGMTRAVANELGDRGIRVNAVTPGFTWSEASRAAGEAYLADRVAGQAIERAIEPEDVADAVGFLAGPDSAMVTGQVLNVDGGSLHY